MLIDKSLIKMELKSKTKEEVIREMANMAFEAGRINDVEKYIKAVLKREEEFTTAVGFGVAIPHGKTDAVKEPLLAFGKTEGVDWNAPDGNPVNMIFLIGVPESDSGTEHLRILANISRKLMKKEFRNLLQSAQTSEDILNILK